MNYQEFYAVAQSVIKSMYTRVLLSIINRQDDLTNDELKNITFSSDFAANLPDFDGKLNDHAAFSLTAWAPHNKTFQVIFDTNELKNEGKIYMQNYPLTPVNAIDERIAGDSLSDKVDDNVHFYNFAKELSDVANNGLGELGYDPNRIVNYIIRNLNEDFKEKHLKTRTYVIM